MLDFKSLNSFKILCASLLLSCGLSACNEVTEATPPASVTSVPVKSSSTSLQAIAVTIAPPEVLLQVGKDHFNKRLPEIAAQPIQNGGILLAGDSITEAWLWHKDYLPLPSSNHGIGWDIAEGLVNRLPLILVHNPDHLFILIGTNDIGHGHSAEEASGHVETFITALQTEKPDTKLYLQAVLPREIASMPKVRAYNAAYEALASEKDVEFIDMTSEFAAADGALKPKYTEDGLHLNAAGYALWGRVLKASLKD